MNRWLKLNIVIILFLLIRFSYGQFDYGFDFSKAGSAGLQFLKIGVGARECAMGEAAIAVSQNANSVFWNVAGLAYVEHFQAALSHNNWLVNSKHDAGVIAFPVGRVVLALSLNALTIDEFEETTVKQPEGTGRMISAGDVAVGLSVAHRFTNKLSIGAQAKFVHEIMDDYTISNVLFDIGTLYYTGFHRLRLGFVLQHFGPDMELVYQDYRTPLLFRVAAADDLIDQPNFKWTVAGELVHPTDNKEWVNFGSEWMLFQSFALRAGYRLNQDEGNLTAGAGVYLPENNWMHLNIDYAYMPFGTVFGDVHRFSVNIGF